jgi:hypothetical protein
MPNEDIFPSESATAASPVQQDSIETRDLNSPGIDSVNLGIAIENGLKQYGTSKPQWQLIKARISYV